MVFLFAQVLGNFQISNFLECHTGADCPPEEPDCWHGACYKRKKLDNLTIRLRNAEILFEIKFKMAFDS